MTNTKSIPFTEFRGFLEKLGYTENRTDSAHIFHRKKKDLLFFRLYRDQEEVDWGDLVSTRKFLDLWGLLDAADFDAFLERGTETA
jgi:hypothetical protein